MLALLAAAFLNDCGLITQLLKIGADAEANPLRIEPLPTAARRGHLEAVHIFLQHATELDSWSSIGRALTCAAYVGYENIVYPLTSAPFLYRHSLRDLESSILLASSRGHCSIVRHLGNLQSLRDNHQLKWDILRVASRSGKEQVVQIAVLEWGLSLNTQQLKSWVASTLGEAAERGRRDVVKFFLA